MTDDRKTVHVRITGRVQGVWFRAWTEQTARGLGLDGWVRNCRDGSVEALFSGPAGKVDEMLSKAHDGPPMAEVEAVDTEAASAPRDIGFQVKPDG